MSPWIPIELKKRFWIFCVGLTGVLAWNMALSTRRQFYAGSIEKVERKDVVLNVRCTGKIEPRNQSVVTSLIRGSKLSMPVKEGDAVKAGDLLMEISDEEIRRELIKTENQYQNKSNDLIKAQKDLALAKKLYRQGAIPRREVEEANEILARARQDVTDAHDDWVRMKEKAKGVRVLAPMDGVVLKASLTTRPTVSEGEELFKIAQLDDLVLRGQVDELEISRVAVGQEAIVTCDAFSNVAMTGEVDGIGAQAKEGSFADVEVLIALTDTKNLKLKPNLTCKTAIRVGELADVVVVKAAAVRRDVSGPYVFKSQVGGWLVIQRVDVGPVTDGVAVVTQGLNGFESVLVPQKK